MLCFMILLHFIISFLKRSVDLPSAETAASVSISADNIQ